MTVPFGRYVVMVNRDPTDLSLNSDLKVWTQPSLAILGDPCHFLLDLAAACEGIDSKVWTEWFNFNSQKDQEKVKSNLEVAAQKTDFINPVKLCLEIDKVIDDNSILIGDGGDFVATVAYNIKARKPLSWLDPGVFGTLGVGAGFAMAAKLVHPESEVWLFWGDGASGFSLMEFDTLRRHKIPVIAVIGNDACWMQIYRDQVVSFNDDVGCGLEFTDYHLVATALGCEGFMIESDDQIEETFRKAKQLNKEGKSVLINAKIGKTDFRKGSLSA